MPFRNRGEIYRVLQMDELAPGVCEDCGTSIPGFYLVGDTPNRDWGRCPCIYRPIYRPNAELIASLLAPAPAEQVLASIRVPA